MVAHHGLQCLWLAGQDGQDKSCRAASKTAAAITTRQLLDRGGWENNPVFGRYPSLAKQASVNGGFFAAQAVTFHFTERGRKPWLRWLGRVGIGLQIEEQVRAAACNAGINVQAAQIQNCGPLVSGL